MSAPTVANLAAAVLQPGFVGTSPPDWVRRWVADGLGGAAPDRATSRSGRSTIPD